MKTIYSTLLILLFFTNIGFAQTDTTGLGVQEITLPYSGTFEDTDINNSSNWFSFEALPDTLYRFRVDQDDRDFNPKVSIYSSTSDSNKIGYLLVSKRARYSYNDVEIITNFSSEGTYYIKVEDTDSNYSPDTHTLTVEKSHQYRLDKTLFETVEPSYINLLFQISAPDRKSGVTWLKEKDFRITENSSSISPSESNLRIGKAGEIPYEIKTVLMIDNSISIGADFPNIKEAALEVVNTMAEFQKIAIYSFSENPELVQDFTGDRDSLNTAIQSIQLGAPTTNLYGSANTGLERWEDSYSIDGIEQGFLVLFTDGSDTQGSSTLSSTIQKRGNKRVYTIGLGDEIEPEVLEQIGNFGFFQVNEVQMLGEIFSDIQHKISNWANSFYWVNYITPKRGDRTHTLEVSVKGNTNTSSKITETFNSESFSSVSPGVVVNPSFSNPAGLDTIKVKSSDAITIFVETIFPIYDPEYSWSVTGPIEFYENTYDSSIVNVYFSGNSYEEARLEINDVSNGHTKEVIFIGAEEIVISNENIENTPDEFELSQNYPNPFNPTTTIRFGLPQASEVLLEIYNIMGQKVATLVDEPKNAGHHTINFDANRLASGIYIYRINTENFVDTKTMILIK